MNEQFFDSDSFTPRARALVKNAVTLAGSWGHTYIGTEHILLSAAYEEDSTACAVLLRHEVTAQRIEEQIAEARHAVLRKMTSLLTLPLF